MNKLAWPIVLAALLPVAALAATKADREAGIQLQKTLAAEAEGTSVARDPANRGTPRMPHGRS